MQKGHVQAIQLAVIGLIFPLVLSVLVNARITSLYIAQIVTLAGINVIMALGLNLITGFTGQLAIGHAGFMAVGAYSTALFMMYFNIPPVFSIILGAMVSGFVGWLIAIPTFRLRGDYLAIVTLAFGEVIRVVIINLPKLTGGAAGLKGIPAFAQGRYLKQIVAMDMVFVFMLLVIAFMYVFIKSSYGRALIAIRDDEIAASSMGINAQKYKIMSFTISAVIAGIGGGLYAPFFGYLSPQGFTFLRSVEILIIVVFGGMGSITGTVVAAFLLTGLQEGLRFLKDYRMVIYPLLLIIMMLFRPQGLFGEKEFSVISFINRIFSGKKTAKDADTGKE